MGIVEKNKKIDLKFVIIVLLITAFMTLVSNFVGKKISPLDALPGTLILISIAFIGIAMAKFIPIKVPSVLYVVTIATIITIPEIFPLAKQISSYTSKVDFLALTTPILAYAGVYSGKDLKSLKSTGWRIFVLAIIVMFSTFICSAIIAHVVLKLIGQI